MKGFAPNWLSGTAFSVISLGLGVGYGLWSRPPERVLFLSVGQGDCTVVQSEGRTVLIDVGPTAERGRGSLVSHLRSLGIREVDEVWLSHPDADHVGALPEVVSAWPSVQVFASVYFERDEKMLKVYRQAHLRPQNVHWIDSETGAVGRFQLQIRCHRWEEGLDDNLGSMFVKVSDGAATMVTTGDGPELEEEDELRNGDWRAEILHFGHHGSKTASSMDWLKAVHPVYGIVSCGKNNPYGHPHRQTLDRAKAAGIQVHRTDLEGDLEFDVDRGTFVPGS